MRGYDKAAELNKRCIKYVDWTFVKLNIFLVVLTYFKFNSIENVFFFFFFSFFFSCEKNTYLQGFLEYLSRSALKQNKS